MPTHERPPSPLTAVSLLACPPFGLIPNHLGLFVARAPTCLLSVTFIGKLPLHLAAKAGATADVVAALMHANPAAAAARSYDGDLPIHLAAESGTSGGAVRTSRTPDAAWPIPQARSPRMFTAHGPSHKPGASGMPASLAGTPRTPSHFSSARDVHR